MKSKFKNYDKAKEFAEFYKLFYPEIEFRVIEIQS